MKKATRLNAINMSIDSMPLTERLGLENKYFLVSAPRCNASSLGDFGHEALEAPPPQEPY